MNMQRNELLTLTDATEMDATTTTTTSSSSSTAGRSRRVSLNDMDSSAHDFWNMTLDDLTAAPHDHHEEDDDVSLSYRSVRSMPTDRAGPQHRRRSDGMVFPTTSSSSTMSSSNKTQKSKGMPRRSVTFGSVRVREHDRVLGDHPCAALGGPSLSLGWKYHDKFSGQGGAIDLQTFEAKKRQAQRKHSWSSSNSTGSGGNSRTSLDVPGVVALSPEAREKIAKRHGFSKQDIAENVKQVEKIQRRRERTRLQVEKECLQEMVSYSHEATLQRFLEAQARKRSNPPTSTTTTSGGAGVGSQRGGRSAVLGGGSSALRI